MPTDERLAVDLIGRTDYGRVATSMRALPFLAFARHIVVDRRVLLRMPRGCGYHHACAGSVVAYGTDNLSSARTGESLWSVQIGPVRAGRADRRRTGALRCRAGPRGRRALRTGLSEYRAAVGHRALDGRWPGTAVPAPPVTLL